MLRALSIHETPPRLRTAPLLLFVISIPSSILSSYICLQMQVMSGIKSFIPRISKKEIVFSLLNRVLMNLLQNVILVSQSMIVMGVRLFIVLSFKS